MNRLRFLLWALLLGGGFLAGVAWKNAENKTSEGDSAEATVVKTAAEDEEIGRAHV